MSDGSGLFRTQVLRSAPHQARPSGLATPPAARLFGWLAALVCAALLAALWQGRYAARQRVQGFLYAADSVLHVTAGRTGRLDQLLVRPGDPVRERQVLFILSGEEYLADGEALITGQADSLAQRRATLRSRRALLQQAWEQQQEAALKRIARLGALAERMAAQVRLHRTALEARRLDVLRTRALAEKGHVPRTALEQARERQLLAQIALEESLLRAGELEDQRDHAESSLLAEHARFRAEDLDLQEQDLQRQAELQRLSARRMSQVLAPRAGIVGDTHAVPGQQLAAGDQVLTLFAPGAPLVAELAVPARIMPSLSEVHTVRLELPDPLQPQPRLVEASVVEVSATPLGAGRYLGPMLLREPAYRLRVRIDRDPADASADADMAYVNRGVSAQLSGPARPLIQWILQPLRDMGASAL